MKNICATFLLSILALAPPCLAQNETHLHHDATEKLGTVSFRESQRNSDGSYVPRLLQR